MNLSALGKLRQFGQGLLGQSSPHIAVDFGVGALKVLQVEPGEPPRLIAAAQADTPLALREDHNARLDFQLGALPKLLKQGGFVGRRVTCAIPAGQTLCKHMQLARPEGVRMGDLVSQAISQHLGCDPAALVYRHTEVQGTTAPVGKTEVICMATPRDFIKRLVSGLAAFKLEPVGMHSEFNAGLRAFGQQARRAEDRATTTLYLDLGAGSTKVGIAHGASMVFARTVEVGGRFFDRLVVEQTGCEPADALRIRLEIDNLTPPTSTHTVSVSPEESVAEKPTTGTNTASLVAVTEPVVAPRITLAEPLEMLTDEILLSLRYHESLFPGRRVDRVVFMGGEARHKALCQHVARALRLPAQLADPMARVARTGMESSSGFDLNSPQPGWSVPLGLALSPTDL